jgi:hypothetical protein
MVASEAHHVQTEQQWHREVCHNQIVPIWLLLNVAESLSPAGRHCCRKAAVAQEGSVNSRRVELSSTSRSSGRDSWRDGTLALEASVQVAAEG